MELDYRYLDVTSVRYRPGARAEPILVAYGTTTTTTTGAPSSSG